MRYVVKRDGRRVPFNSVKIYNAIKRSSDEVNSNLKESELFNLVEKIISRIDNLNLEEISVEDIQNNVEDILSEFNFNNIKKAYANYRSERTRVRGVKSDLMKAIEKIGIETDRDNGATSCC